MRTFPSGIDPTHPIALLAMKTLMAAVLSVVLSSFASFAVCAELPFNQYQFDATRLAGRPVAVVFHADWCPTCHAQAPVLKELAATPAL